MAAQGLRRAVSLDHSKQIGNVWKLGATMRAQDVACHARPGAASLGAAAGRLTQHPRLLSDNGCSYIAADLAKWLGGPRAARPIIQ